MKLFIFVFIFSSNALLGAEIPLYKTTDNTGLNKLERIDVIEKYLINISGTLQKIESSVEGNVQKISSLEKAFLEMKENDIKNKEKIIKEKVAVTKTPEMDELNKLQADLTTLKNEDIESIRMQIQGLKSSIQLLQSQNGQK